MMLDIGFIVLLIIFIFLGYRRGFSLEFFNMFKYIFIIFILLQKNKKTVSLRQTVEKY